MKQDEFAFFNQQLAVMLRDGIPLEGGLRQLCAGMKTGQLRNELERLEADLSRGTPIREALAQRELPSLYKQMVSLGVQANDLPGVLTLLADYYHRANALWTRLTGLLVYPVLVIGVSLVLTLVLSLVFSRFLSEFFIQFAHGPLSGPGMLLTAVWLPPALFAVVVVLGITAYTRPEWRGWFRWRLPAFREASLAQLASTIALALKNGTTLPDALGLAAELEARTPAAAVLTRWKSQVESGEGKPAQWSAVRPIPELFLWLIQNSGEDVAAGFQKAANIYRDRANYKIEMALYGALPTSVLLLGLMILWQAAPLLRAMIQMMNSMGDS